MSTYVGKCINGPLNGQMLHSDATVHTVAKMEPPPSRLDVGEIPNMPLVIPTGEYTYDSKSLSFMWQGWKA